MRHLQISLIIAILLFTGTLAAQPPFDGDTADVPPGAPISGIALGIVAAVALGYRVLKSKE